MINTKAFHGAFLSHGAVRFGAVLPHRTAPYDFAFNTSGGQVCSQAPCNLPYSRAVHVQMVFMY